MDVNIKMRTRFADNNPDQKAGIIFFTVILPALCYGFLVWFIFFSGLLGTKDSFIVIITPLVFATGFLYAIGKNILVPNRFMLNEEGVYHREMGDLRMKRKRMLWHEVAAVVTTVPKGRKIIFFLGKKKMIGCGYGFSEDEKKRVMDIVREWQTKHSYQVIEDVDFMAVFSIMSDISDGNPIRIPEPASQSVKDEFIKSVHEAKILAYSIFGIGFGAFLVNLILDINVLFAFSISMTLVGLAVMLAIHLALRK